MAEQLALPFPVVQPLLAAFKTRQWLALKGSTSLNDYVYEITDSGLQRARQSAGDCSYCGAVPVSLDDYARAWPRSRWRRHQPRMKTSAAPSPI